MVYFRPKTVLGWISAGLLGSFMLFFGIFFLLVAFGERGGQYFFSNLRLALPFLIAAVSGSAAFLTGTASVIKKERAILVFAALITGFFVALWIFAELAFPH